MSPRPAALDHGVPVWSIWKANDGSHGKNASDAKGHGHEARPAGLAERFGRVEQAGVTGSWAAVASSRAAVAATSASSGAGTLRRVRDQRERIRSHSPVTPTR